MMLNPVASAERTRRNTVFVDGKESFMRTRAQGYAVHAEKTPLAPFTFERRDLRPNDVGIEIL